SHELSDDDVTAVLTKEAKRRSEAAEAYREGGRTESAATEEAEAAIIAEYLPRPLSDDELDALVDAAHCGGRCHVASGHGCGHEDPHTPDCRTGGRQEGRRRGEDETRVTPGIR